VSNTEKDYQQAAEWAEDDMTLKPASTTALRGEAATKFGRDLLERATGGRPSIDPNARPGQHSPVRQVRLPAEVNEQLTALADAEHRSPSDIIRAALADYIAAHTAS
jgi:hypothetical protein